MRDVKIVAYGSISPGDELLITNFLEEKECAVRIYSVDTPLTEARKTIGHQRQRIEELEAEAVARNP